jgi:glycerophosphoryl diester phosphodiesterase
MFFTLTPKTLRWHIKLVSAFVLAAAAAAGAIRGQSESRKPEGATPVGFYFFEPVQPPRQVQVMVHRGLAAAAPENSQPAIAACIAEGFEWVEIDLRRSIDGVHVVAHDDRLDEKTSGHGRVRDHTVEELQKLEAGSWFARRFIGTRVLTLAQALEICRGRVNLYLDCKDVNANQLAGEILSAGMQRQVIVYGDLATAAAVHRASQGKVAVMMKWRPSGDIDAWIERNHLSVVEIDANEVTGEVCKAFHRRGVTVQAKTLGPSCDRPEVWTRMMAAGVDWIQTDDPHGVLDAALRFRNVPRRVEIAFHRGANALAPENTMPAIAKAGALGADYIELDIRTSKDGRFFLLHDSQLGRTTSGSGPIRERTTAELASLDAGSWFGRQFRGLNIPTFEQGLAAVKAGPANLYADAKDIAPEALLDLLRKHQMVDRTVVYQSPSYLKKLKALDRRVRLLPPLRDPGQIEKLALELKPYGVDTAWDILSQELIDRCHAAGIKVFSDALGNHETVADYRRAISWGIDVIQTDHPARLFRALELEALPRRP